MKSQPVRSVNKRRILAIALAGVILLGLGIVAVSALYRSTVIGTPASQGAPSFGIVVDQNMRVVSVETGGAADRGGIQVGDVLKMLNKNQLTDPAQARKVLDRVDRSKRITFVLTRDDQEMTFQIQPAPMQGVQGAKTPTPVPPDQLYF